MKRAGLLLMLCALPASGAPGGARGPLHKIAVDVRGPVALVQVTRALLPDGSTRESGELVLDLALPERAALIDLEVADGARWRPAEAIETARGRDLYLEAVRARGLHATAEPFDDSTVYRIRVARDAERGGAPVTLRYRFSVLPDFADGRRRVRFPAAPESLPAPADVTVALTGAADVEIAGARTTLPAVPARGAAAGRASTRSGWEISWAPRNPGVAGDAPGLEGAAAAAALSPTESVLAFPVQGRAARPAGPPTNVLFLIDRSRSVGLAGLSAERDVARRLLEALPPATRFDVLFF